MKILSSYPARIASVADLTRDLKLLAASGADWGRRTKRMASNLPELDMFGAGFVERYSFGWRLTAKGLEALEAMENDPGGGSALDAPAIAAGTHRVCRLAAPTSQEIAAARRSQFGVIDGGQSDASMGPLPVFTGETRTQIILFRHAPHNVGRQ